ncbi:DUF3011 domain-containing protein [Dokdonella soli]|uniref:DUF3011 domain-containing protein n=1 Tax=Dokdonella soli TaxID=529810 RepID=A0ABP3TSA4_9GAMM
MLKPVCGVATLVLSFCAAVASAQAPVQLATAIDAAAAAQYGGDWQPGPGWDRDIDVRCGSRGYAYNMCQVDTGQGSRVAIVRQISNTRCVEGRNWGWNRAGIWVDQGCEGVFRVQRRWATGPGPGPGPGWQPGAGWDQDITVSCGSPQYKYAMCQVDTGRGSRVYLQRQTSDTRCVEGRNWGWNRAGIWVDQGCGGIFIVERRWR